MLAPPDRPDQQFERDLLAAMPRVRQYAMALCRHPSRADDLAQTVFLRAFERHYQFTRGTNLFAWLCTIAHNAFVQERRRVTKWEVEDVDGRHSLAVEAGDDQETSADAALILSRINAMPPSYGVTLTMYGLGYEYDEIAAVTGVACGTVKSRINRGRALLGRAGTAP